jgi:hypothetical protein
MDVMAKMSLSEEKRNGVLPTHLLGENNCSLFISKNASLSLPCPLASVCHSFYYSVAWPLKVKQCAAMKA